MADILAVVGCVAAVIGVIIAYLQLRRLPAEKRDQQLDGRWSFIRLAGGWCRGLRGLHLRHVLVSRADLDDRSLDQVAELIEAAAVLIEEDRLPGSWGRTIGHYIALTQQEGTWSDSEIAKYLSSGSLTHTYHALNGLRAYHRLAPRPFSVDVACNVVRYLRTWRLENGAFATPVTNFDAAAGSPDRVGAVDQDLFRRQVPQLLRHTATGVLAINRLLDLRDMARVTARDDVHAWAQLATPLEEYAVKALRVLGSYSAQLEVQTDSRSTAGWAALWGRVKYTPAYIVLAVDEGLARFGDRLSADTRSQLERSRALLIDYIVTDGIEHEERFLCQRANPKAYYYYSVFILEHFLGVPLFAQDLRAAGFCRQIVDALNEVLLGAGGLPYGHANVPDKPWLDYPDVGVTARYLGVLCSYRRQFSNGDDPALADAFRHALTFVLAGHRDLDKHAYNQLTHGWEALLQLPTTFDADVRGLVARRLSQSDVVTRANEFARMVADRCFVGRTARDQRLRLLGYLQDFPLIGEAAEAVRAQVSETGNLGLAIEKLFTRASLVEFLERYKIPFRKDASQEQITADLLWQFGFEPLPEPGRIMVR